MNKNTENSIKRIDQFVHTLQYGDAISGEAITIMHLLRESGINSDIYSINTHEKLKNIPKHFSNYKEDENNSTIILHYSIASPLNNIYSSVISSKTKKALIYHNLTPLKWYQAYNARVSADLVKGRDELPALLKLSDLVIADSSFNASEAREMGASNVQVLPLTLDPKRWDMPKNQGISAALKNHGGKNILHVGRIAPNKCLEDIIKGFYFYHHKFNKNSKLWFVGSDTDTEIYSFELRKLVKELSLKDMVEFVGAVSDDELRAFFEESDAYICMSEHEGFCVPLIEALNFKLPVIAFNSSAIPETLGNAGILLNEKDPLLLGLLMNEVCTNLTLREKLISEG